MTGQPDRTALYRIFGEADALLYIGITNGVPFRWNGHQAVQPWWDELRSLMVEWHDSREEAEAAEKAAIQAEQPKYNVTYLRPSRIGREQQRPEVKPVDWEGVVLAPRDDDEGLLNMEDLAQVTRQHSWAAARRALKMTGGPEGFVIGGTLVFRRGEIRKWIAAIEAAQAVRAPEADPAKAGAA